MRTASRTLFAAGLMTLVWTSPVWAQAGASEISLNKGIQSFMAEDYAASRRHFEAALTLDPDFAAAHYFLGLTLLQSASSEGAPAVREALLERALSEFEQARLRDPQLVLAYMDAAIAHTILGRFEQAESSFQKFISERPDDPLPYVFLAVAYYRQGQEDPSSLDTALANLDKAQSALDRAARPDRSLEAHVRFYRGLIYLQQNKGTEAREELQEVATLEPDSEIARQSEELLEGYVERRPWELTLEVGYDYDTNVMLKGHHVKRLPGEDKPNDWRFGLSSAFTYRIVDEENFLLGVGTTTYDSWHTDIQSFDVQNYGANVYTAYRPPDADFLTLALRYDWDYTFVGNDSFLTRHRVTPQIDIQETDWTGTTFFYQFDYRDYHNQPANFRLDRDGPTHSYGVVQRFELFEMYDRPFTTNISYRFENVMTDGTEFASDNHIFALGVGVPLPWDVTFDFVNEFEVDFYEYRSIFDYNHSKRRDFIHTMIFALTKDFSEQLSMRFQVDVTNDDSNVEDGILHGQEFFSYNRVNYGLSMIYRF